MIMLTDTEKSVTIFIPHQIKNFQKTRHRGELSPLDKEHL